MLLVRPKTLRQLRRVWTIGAHTEGEVFAGGAEGAGPACPNVLQSRRWIKGRLSTQRGTPARCMPLPGNPL